MINITVNDQQLRQGEESLRVLEALVAERITGSNIMLHLMKEQGIQMSNRHGALRLERREYEVRVGRNQFVITQPVWKSISEFGTLGEQMSQIDGTDFQTLGLYLLKCYVTQLKRYIPIKLYVLGSGGLVGLSTPGYKEEYLLWGGMHIALICMRLSPNEIIERSMNTNDDILCLVR